MKCRLCCSPMNFAEKTVRFIDEESGEDWVTTIEATWCSGCAEDCAIELV